METTEYNKPFLTNLELANLLVERGFKSENSDLIICLEKIGYYRLSGYSHTFLQRPKHLNKFKKKTKIEDITRLYDFDQKLRSLLFNNIAKIEIALRSSIVSVGTEFFDNNPFWLTERNSYACNARCFNDIVNKIESSYNKSSEDFAKHFRNTYSNRFPPSWILSELFTLGNITTIYAKLPPRLKKKIAKKFNLDSIPFESWISILQLTRNICCHHARLWNKYFAQQPAIPRNNPPRWINNIRLQRNVYFNICVIKHFLDVIEPRNIMAIEMKELLQDYPQIKPEVMGFPYNWQLEEIWQ